MNKEGKLYKTITFLDEYADELWNITTNGLGFAVIGILYELDRDIFWGSVHSQKLGLILLIFVFILNLILGTRLIKKNKSKEDLINENESLGQKIQFLENTIDEIQRNSLEVFNEHLASMFYKLKLSANERISFYKYQDQQFHIVGRYSINPKLIQRNRKYYPSNEGLIGKAWQDGIFHLNQGVPECVNGSKQTYYSFIRNLNDIPVDTLKTINMKSRSFYLKAFTDSRNIKRNSIIVIESLNSNELAFDIINTVVEEEEQKLVSFIERLSWEMPSLKIANEKGF
jgi:hypothetical protein